MLRCFAHNDPKVRYTACETMFNIVTICREAIVRDNINDVFKHVIRVSKLYKHSPSWSPMSTKTSNVPYKS